MDISKAIEIALQLTGDRLRKTYDARVGRSEDEATGTGMPNEVFVRINGETEATTALFPVGFDISTLEYDAPVRVRKEKNQWVVITTDAVAGVSFWEGAPPGTSFINAPVVLRTSFATLPNASILADLATGYVKVTTSTGVLSSQATPIPVADGGTGASTFTANRILIGNGTSAISTITTGASGTYLRSNGTVGVFATLNMDDAGAGTLVVGRGGTGATTHTANALLVGAGTSAITSISPSTSGNILQSNGTLWQSVAPSFNASVITAGTLLHERGGLEADVSAYDGLIQIKSGATSNIKTNMTATVAPTVNEDSGDGYSVGSLWYDVTADKAYTALDVTLGGAVWKEITASGGAGTVTSVGLTSTNLTVTGSPITTSGTLTVNAPSSLSASATNSLYTLNGSVTELQSSVDNGTDASGTLFNLYRSEGTRASPTASTASLTSLADIGFYGYGTSFATGALIRAKNTELWTATAHGTQLEFHTTPDASTATAVALTLNQDKSATFASSITATGNVNADKIVLDTTVGTSGGGIGYNSTNKALNAYTAGIEQYLGGILYRGTVNKSVASTAVKTSLIPTSGVGTVTLPANFFTAGRMLRYTIRGQVGSLNTTDTLQFDLLLGGTSISLSTARARAITATRGFEITGELVCYTTGVSGTITGGATYVELQPNYVNFVWTPASGVTVNTTGSLAFDITAQWSASSASNSIIAYTFILEAL